MHRPKRKAAPTVFVDNGVIPPDESFEDKSIENESDLLKSTESDVCSGSYTEEDAIVVNKTKNNTKNNANADEVSVKKKNLRVFQLIPESVIEQSPTLKITLTKKIKDTQYTAPTALQAAKQIAPILYARKKPQTGIFTFSYMFTIEEICEIPKKFTYVTEHIVDPHTNEVTHNVKAKPKTIQKPDKNEVKFIPTIERPPLPTVKANIGKKRVPTKDGRTTIISK
jgi:hypothetical protein